MITTVMIMVAMNIIDFCPSNMYINDYRLLIVLLNNKIILYVTIFNRPFGKKTTFFT